MSKMIEVAGDRYLAREQVAALLGRSARCLRRWEAEGTGPKCIKLGGITPYYREQDIADYLRNGAKRRPGRPRK